MSKCGNHSFKTSNIEVVDYDETIDVICCSDCDTIVSLVEPLHTTQHLETINHNLITLSELIKSTFSRFFLKNLLKAADEKNQDEP